MISVIIAGGAGSRLWPLSTPDYPKHLLVIDDSEESLLQKTYKRASSFSSDVYVMTESSHSEIVKKQLSHINQEKVLIEPGRRGTANCTVAVLAHLSAIGQDVDEPICILWADHYIRDLRGFKYSLKLAEDFSRKYNRIVLVGVEPDYAATSFGYIEMGDVVDEKSLISDVKCFREKPDHKTAKKYFNSGKYLWNSGYFVGSIKTFLNSMGENAPELKQVYDKLKSHQNDKFAHDKEYLELETENIDNALLERVSNLAVVPATFDWLDLGSYGDLHKAVGGDESGNNIVGRVEVEGVENSFVYNKEDKPVAVIGLDNVAIINTKDGILVARKDLAQKVGEVSKRL